MTNTITKTCLYNLTPYLCFEQKCKKKISFIWKFSGFLVVKFSVYLNRRVFVTKNISRWKLEQKVEILIKDFLTNHNSHSTETFRIFVSNISSRECLKKLNIYVFFLQNCCNLNMNKPRSFSILSGKTCRSWSYEIMSALGLQCLLRSKGV